MKQLTILLLILIAALSGVASAQDETAAFTARVKVESAFVRAAPSLDAEPVASIFQKENLEAIGRNIDGTWFEVRRPGRLYNLGWVFNEMVSWDFAIEKLPLTDFVTDLEGAQPLSKDPGFAAFIVEGVALRSGPTLQSQRIINIPPNVTVPVLERNQDGSWLHVNYKGYDGWTIGFAARQIANLMSIPQAVGLPPLATIPVIVIPPEIQLAQVERLRSYITVSREVAVNLENFWFSVYRGQIMPCEPPPFMANYPYSEQDVRELPELKRYIPRLTTAIDYLNSAITPLYGCGAFDADAVLGARNAAINARIIFDANLDVLKNLEENVIR